MAQEQTDPTDVDAAAEAPSADPTDVDAAAEAPSADPADVDAAAEAPSADPADVDAAAEAPSADPADVDAAAEAPSADPADVDAAAEAPSADPADVDAAAEAPSADPADVDAAAEAPSADPADVDAAAEAPSADPADVDAAAEAPSADPADVDAAAEAPSADPADVDAAAEAPSADPADVDAAAEAPSADPADVDAAAEAPSADPADVDAAAEAPSADPADVDAAAEAPPADSSAGDSAATDWLQDLQNTATEIAEASDVDVVLLNGVITMEAAQLCMDLCAGRRRRTDVLLVLVTYGGDAHAAYWIARCFQEQYGAFSVFVPTYCKSAGTLIATGANELIISDRGELGPLDVQMPKEDEIGQLRSGLTIMDTLAALEDRAFAAYEYFMLRIKAGGGDPITLKMASSIASEMASNLFSSLYGQVDPLSIGEAGREVRVASSYGERLLRVGGNITEGSLNRLITDYPSHAFVIDRSEAKQLFRRVREPSSTESDLARCLGPYAEAPMWGSSVKYLSEERTSPNDEGTIAEGTGTDETADESA